MTLRHDCQKHGCYKDTLPDWGVLDGCFPGRISPTDLDGIVEIDGCFLFLEWKRPGASLKRGQEILIERLAAKGHHVYVVWGPVKRAALDAGARLDLRIYSGTVKFVERRGITLADLRKTVCAWVRHVKAGGAA